MKKEELVGICSALVSIAEYECCHYGFTEYIDKAEEYLNENEVESAYKEKWERLNYLINKAVIKMDDRYELLLINKDNVERDAILKLEQELHTLKNVRYLIYQLDHTNDVSQIDIVIGGDK